MDSNTTYTKTARGLRALVKKLPRDAGHVLSVIDKSLTADEILAKLNNISEKDLEFAITWLLEGGFIKSVVTDPFPNSMWDVSTESAIQVDEIGLDEFTVSEKLPITIPNKLPITNKTEEEIRAEAEEKAKLEVKKKMLEQADAEARERAEAALKAKKEAEAQVIANKEKAIQEARDKAEAEAKAKAEAEANAKKEEEARRKAQEKAAAEEKARLDKAEKIRLEAVAKAEKEARDKAEAEAKAKAEAEANAKKEEEARRKAEEKAAAEEKARLDKAEKIRLEAVAKAEKEARDKAEAEAKAKAEAEANAKKEEEARRKAEEKAAKEEKARLDKEEKIKAKEAAAEKAQQEALEKAAAKEQARLEALAKKEEKAIKKAESKAEAQINRQRFVKNLRAKMPGKQWLVMVLKSIKPISIFAMAVLFLLVIAAQLVNLRILIDPIEKIATENIQDQVNIKSINISLFPSPHLLLKEITIADSTTINAKKIRVYPNLYSLKDRLFNASNTPYKIQEINIEGLSIAQKDIARITSWSGASSRHQQLKIEKIRLEKLSLNLNVVQLPYLEGDLLLDEAGLLQKANFTTESKNFNIEINQSENDYLINIAAIRWRAPLSPHPIFTKLNASGAITNQILTLSSIDCDLYNGNLTAEIEINLNSATLASKGNFSLKNFYIGDMAKELQLDTVVDGKLSINGDYAFDVNKPLNRIDMTDLNATFDIKNGQLRKVDLTEAMRSGNLSGTTDFSTLSGNIYIKNQVVKINNLLLKDNQLQATGQISISPDSHVSGVISSKIAVKGNPISARLIIDGPITALKLKN